MSHTEAIPALEETHGDPRDRLQVLYCSDNEAAVLLKRDGAEWLIREVAYYEPMPFVKAVSMFPDIYYPDYEGDYPYATYGERYIVDLTTQRILSHDFSAEEGNIQGLVYALLAMRDGGPFPSEDYERYITEQLIPEDFTELAQTSLPDIQAMKNIVDRNAGGL